MSAVGVVGMMLSATEALFGLDGKVIALAVSGGLAARAEPEEVESADVELPDADAALASRGPTT